MNDDTWLDEFLDYLNNRMRLRLAGLVTKNPSMVLNRDNMLSIAREIAMDLIIEFPPKSAHDEAIFVEMVCTFYEIVIDETLDLLRNNGARPVRNPRLDQIYKEKWQ